MREKSQTRRGSWWYGRQTLRKKKKKEIRKIQSGRGGLVRVTRESCVEARDRFLAIP